MTISIIIPNYNGEELLKKNLSQVIEVCEYYESKSNNLVEVIVVDDRSTDESVKLLRSFVENNHSDMKVSFIEKEKNEGFASTVNIGVAKTVSDIVVLLNSDVNPEKDFLTFLIPHFTNEKVFAVACVDKSIENGRTVLKGRGIGKWEKGLLVHSAGELDKTNTLWASGGSSAFKRDLWNKLGGFDTLYNPFYWEDIDLSYRALKSGYTIIFEKKSKVRHFHEEGAIKSKYSGFQIQCIAYRNQFIFAWKNATDLELRLHQIFWFPYHIVYGFLRFDIPFFLGLFQFLSRLTEISKKRKDFQKLFVKKDKEVVSNFNQ